MKHFHSILDDTGISQKDYTHAQNVFDAFGCKNMLDYCELYNALDTLLLAEVFSAYRDNFMKTLRLDPAYYFGTPSAANDVMLLSLEEPLDLYHDPEMAKMTINGIRGGQSFINTRHAKGIHTPTILYIYILNTHQYQCQLHLHIKYAPIPMPIIMPIPIPIIFH
jgi:hypothetical protein